VRSLWLVARREFEAYWTSPVAYVVLAVFLLLSGVFFFGQLSEVVGAASAGQPVNVNEQLIRSYFYTLSVMFLFLVPLLTMRLVSEEIRQGTLEIVLTTPLRESVFVLGKFAAAVGYLVILLAGAGIHVAILYLFGKPDTGPVLTGFLGLFLTGGAYVALGLFLSTVTQSQVVAGAASFALFLLLWLVHWLGTVSSGFLSRALTAISFVQHFDSFGKGVLDSGDVVFFISLIGLGLYAASQSVLSRRWKT
jgi:gliding motility-associated transport system permease protein